MVIGPAGTDVERHGCVGKRGKDLAEFGGASGGLSVSAGAGGFEQCAFPLGPVERVKLGIAGQGSPGGQGSGEIVSGEGGLSLSGEGEGADVGGLGRVGGEGFELGVGGGKISRGGEPLRRGRVLGRRRLERDWVKVRRRAESGPSPGRGWWWREAFGGRRCGSSWGPMGGREGSGGFWAAMDWGTMEEGPK